MNETRIIEDLAGGREDIQDITRTLKNMSAEMVQLLAVEARLFGHTVLAMIGLTIVMSVLLVSSWLLVAAALAIALASLQAFSLTGALLTVAAAHLLLVALMVCYLRYMTRDLAFRESRASLNSLVTQSQVPADAAGQRPPVE